MHPFSTPWKHQKTVKFSEGRERVHRKQMGQVQEMEEEDIQGI